MIVSGALWDVAGALGALPSWWPPVSYVILAAGVAAACIAALLSVLTDRRTRPVRSAGDAPADQTAASPAGADDPRRTARHVGAQLLATGVLLVAWLLRGHAEIPPDPPLVAAETVAAILYVFAGRRSLR